MTLCPKVILRRGFASIYLNPSGCRPILELLSLRLSDQERQRAAGPSRGRKDGTEPGRSRSREIAPPDVFGTAPKILASCVSPGRPILRRRLSVTTTRG